MRCSRPPIGTARCPRGSDHGSPSPLVRGYEVVIGLETHAQLHTRSKAFSGASTAFGAAPNTQASAVDLALPGTLPVLNRAAVECAIRFGLAVGARIANQSIFARKNYFYPDLPKGYQISQYETPVVQGGRVPFAAGRAAAQPFTLTRAHLEEDAGKSLHEGVAPRRHDGRASTSTAPARRCWRSSPSPTCARPPRRSSTRGRCTRWWCGWASATATCRKAASAATPTCRCASRAARSARGARSRTSTRSGSCSRRSSSRSTGRSTASKTAWPIEQATVLFDPDSGETRAMRSKEDAHDYRYFPDPDLPPLVIAPRVDRASARPRCPSCPARWPQRFVRDDGLPAYDAAMMTQSLAFARYYEAARDACGQPKLVANWLMGEVVKRLNARLESIDRRLPVAAVDAGRADDAHRRRHGVQQRRAAGIRRLCGAGDRQPTSMR